MVFRNTKRYISGKIVFAKQGRFILNGDIVPKTSQIYIYWESYNVQ